MPTAAGEKRSASGASGSDRLAKPSELAALSAGRESPSRTDAPTDSIFIENAPMNPPGGRTREESWYEEMFGRPAPRLPDDHPDAWQWEYRGGKAEFEELQQRIGLLKDDGGPVKIDGQEELFE